MVITDLGGNIEYSNAKFTELTGIYRRRSLWNEFKCIEVRKNRSKSIQRTLVYDSKWKKLGEESSSIEKKLVMNTLKMLLLHPSSIMQEIQLITWLCMMTSLNNEKQKQKVLEQQAELEKSYRELEQEKKNAEAAFAETEKLNEFTRIINSTIDTSTILKEIYTYICERTGFDIVWILLINKKKNQVFSDPTLSIFGSPEKLDFDYFSHFRKKNK
jgi:hypothetical protein